MTDSTRSGAPADWDRLAEIYERVQEGSVAERRQVIEELRQTSPALADELVAMLEATPTAAGLEIEARFRITESTPSLEPGVRLGPWRLLRFLARGGMGEVYLAERADGQFEQQAAVKLLRPGVASADLLERFRLERNLLARLVHPAVVPLLDAGTAPDGRPYLALRYVDGRPITLFCAETGASARRRGELFVELCRAVQFAHANLVVHRDLKPSNVLVSDGGRVHLLDFGIAKLLSSASETSEPTRALDLAPMTPQRAAPEQRRGEPVTTATDVWALGLLLHELMTGTLPAAAQAGGAALDRDLGAVVGRATAPEPERRYSSAGELAEDVERWLRGEPVRARPDSFGYRARRFVGRHRLAVVAAAATSVALALLSLVSVLRSREAAREREAASREAKRSEAVVDLVVDLFGGLDPISGADLDSVRVSDLIAQGAAKAAKLDDQPDVQARLRHVLGRIQLERSAWVPARELLKAARDAEVARLPPDDLGAVAVELDYARALHSTGERAAALAEGEAALARVEGSAAAPPLLLANALGATGSLDGGAQGEARLERALAILRSTPGADRLEIASCLTSLGWIRRLRGEAEASRGLFAESLAIVREERGETHPHTLGLRSSLASMLSDPAERMVENEAILALRRERLGEHHYQVANSWTALGGAQLDTGSFAAAAESFARAHTIWVETDGPGNPMSLAALRNLARALDRADRPAAAATSWDRLAADMKHSPADPRTLASYHVDLALRQLGLKQPAAAETEAAAALTLLASTPQPAPVTTARAQAARGRALLALGREADARPLLESASATFEKRPPENPEEAAAVRRALGLN